MIESDTKQGVLERQYDKAVKARSPAEMWRDAVDDISNSEAQVGYASALKAITLAASMLAGVQVEYRDKRTHEVVCVQKYIYDETERVLPHPKQINIGDVLDAAASLKPSGITSSYSQLSDGREGIRISLENPKCEYYTLPDGMNEAMHVINEQRYDPVIAALTRPLTRLSGYLFAEGIIDPNVDLREMAAVAALEAATKREERRAKALGGDGVD